MKNKNITVFPKSNPASHSSAYGTADISVNDAAYRADIAKENNVIGSKIAEARKIAGLKQSELSEKMLALGIDVTAQSISKWEKGDATPNAYQLIALGYALGIPNISEYFSGSAPGNAQELNAEGLRHLHEYKEFLVASGKYTVKPVAKHIEMREFKVYDLALSAGPGNPLDESGFDYMMFPASSIPAEADFAAKVSGTSMEPVYNDGQYVFIQQCETLSPGEIGIFYLDGMAYIKLYDEQMPDESIIDNYIDSYGVLHKQPVLISYNTKNGANPPRPVLQGQTFMIMGRVLN